MIMAVVRKQQSSRRRAQASRERFETRLGNVRRGVSDVASQGRRKLEQHSPEMLPWVFAVGLLFGLRRPLSLRGAMHGLLRFGRMGNVLSVTAGKVAHSELGQEIGHEAVALAERIIHPYPTETALTEPAQGEPAPEDEPSVQDEPPVQAGAGKTLH